MSAGYRLREAELLFQEGQLDQSDRLMRGVVRKNPFYAGMQIMSLGFLACGRKYVFDLPFMGLSVWSFTEKQVSCPRGVYGIANSKHGRLFDKKKKR